MIGPKALATFCVPRDWTMNRPSKMTMLTTMVTRVVTMPCRAWMVFRPSTADSTEIAGVMTESP
jgi:hypothetical protein